MSHAIRHFQIRDNASREIVHQKKVRVTHIGGKDNPTDIFTKEQKDTEHFLKLRNIIISLPFNSDHSLESSSTS